MNGAQLLVLFNSVLAFIVLVPVFVGWRAGRNELVVERLLGRQEVVAVWPRDSHWLARRVRRTGIQYPRPWSLGATVLTLLPVWSGLRLLGIIGALGGLLLAALSYRVALDMLYQHRLKRMIRQTPRFLDQMVRSLHAGRTLGDAPMQAVKSAEEPLRDVLTLTYNHVLLDTHLSEALQEVAELYKVEELRILALGVSVNHRYGDNTSDLPDSIVKFIRGREKLSQQLYMMTGETRIGAYVLAGVSNALGDYILADSPGYLLDVRVDDTGHLLLLASLGLRLLGCYVLWHMLESVQEVAMQAQRLIFATLPMAAGGALLLLLQMCNSSHEWRLAGRRLRALASPSGSTRWLAGVTERMGDSLWVRRLQLVGSEIRQLLQQAGQHENRYRVLHPTSVFLTSLLFVLLVLLVKLLCAESETSHAVPLLSAADIGFLLPRQVLERSVKTRRTLIIDEMTLFVQLVRVLFDVGLTVEQTLCVVCLEDREITPQLTYEPDPALIHTGNGINLAGELDMLTRRLQVDPLDDCYGALRQMLHQGGSAHSTLLMLKQLFEDWCLAALQERIGKLSAKMNLVIVVLLSPTLSIVLAGPGVIAIIKTLGGLG